MHTKHIKEAATAGVGPAAAFVTITGFFCDVVKPYTNLVPLFLILSLVAAGASYFFFIHKKHDLKDVDVYTTKGGKIFGATVISVLFWTVMLPVFAITPERGMAASSIPAVGEWQEHLLGRLDTIETKIDEGFEEVLTKIEAIDASAGLVTNPTTANDHYHNARVHEMDGNLIEAKKSYEAYFEYGLEYIDPYLSYSQLLKNLEGKTTAREMMGQLRADHFQSPSANLAYIVMKEDREERIELLEALKQQHPQYGPVSYFYGREFSFAEAGTPTNEERRTERETFEALLELEESQGLSKFYIDKKVSDENLAFVEQELGMLEGIMGNMLDEPVSFRVDVLDRRVSISFVPTELVKKIFYRLDGEGEFQDTGTMGVAMAGSDDPLPNYQVMEPITVGDHFVEMKYIDQKGQESPVYRHDFTVQDLQIQSNPYKMVDPQSGEDQYMIYWTTFDGSKEYVFRYSVDNESLDREVEFGSLFLMGLEPGSHTIFLQGVADDGSTTNVASMTFDVL